MTRAFVKAYRKVLADLNIGAAEEDTERHKAFDGSFSGEMSWALPERKIVPLIKILYEAIASRELTVNAVEIVHGKLNHIAELSPPMKFLMGNVIHHLRNFLQLFGELNEKSGRGKLSTFPVNENMVGDLKTLIAILRYSIDKPLPIVYPVLKPGIWALEIYTDISGHITQWAQMG